MDRITVFKNVINKQYELAKKHFTVEFYLKIRQLWPKNINFSQKLEDCLLN